MLEQEIASIIKYTLEKAGNPSPYYDEVPEGFLVPAVYFPVPEISSRGDTFASYAFSYTWFIKFFHIDTPTAHAIGVGVLTALQRDRNLIPLIGDDGEKIGKNFRIKDPSYKKVDSASGVVQLQLSWDSVRPYDDTKSQKMMDYSLELHARSAYNIAVEQSQQRAD